MVTVTDIPPPTERTLTVEPTLHPYGSSRSLAMAEPLVEDPRFVSTTLTLEDRAFLTLRMRCQAHWEGDSVVISNTLLGLDDKLFAADPEFGWEQFVGTTVTSTVSPVGEVLAESIRAPKRAPRAGEGLAALQEVVDLLRTESPVPSRPLKQKARWTVTYDLPATEFEPASSCSERFVKKEGTKRSVNILCDYADESEPFKANYVITVSDGRSLCGNTAGLGLVRGGPRGAGPHEGSGRLGRRGLVPTPRGLTAVQVVEAPVVDRLQLNIFSNRHLGLEQPPRGDG